MTFINLKRVNLFTKRHKKKHYTKTQNNFKFKSKLVDLTGNISSRIIPGR